MKIENDDALNDQKFFSPGFSQIKYLSVWNSNGCVEYGPNYVFIAARSGQWPVVSVEAFSTVRKKVR